MGKLSDLSFKLSYRSKGEESMVDELINPALKNAVMYKRSAGFFSSSVYELIGEGIEALCNRNGEIRLICSPQLSEDDRSAICAAYELKDEIVQESVKEEIRRTIAELNNENILLLVSLIERGCLNIMFVSPDDEMGIYHDKIGIIIDGDNNKILFVGSSNESKSGYKYNYEKVRVSVSWKDGDIDRINDDEEEFDSIWFGKNPYIKRLDFTELLRRELDNERKKRGLVESTENAPIKLRDYQKEAIDAWTNNAYKGFYVMATGTGKTWTAIYSALEIIKKEPILLVICAPYKHLVKQWYEDVHKVLADCATVLVSSENPTWRDELADAIFSSKYTEKKTVVAISTIKSFFSEKFEKIVSKSQMERMLIVDEAHRFKNLSSQIKEKYKYMLGLSATPASRKNDEFAEQLVDFFGGKVYDLPIEFAIERGYLVKYNYYPIYIDASAEDEEKFNKYTRLMLGCFKNGKCIDLESLARYKRARLRTIAMAEGKIQKIEWILSQLTEKDHFIVYCGDGKLNETGEEIRHIQYIKNVLDNLGYKSSQFTADENMEERIRIVDSFNRGMIDSMVAIRCLDEGINIPSIKGALLLSSNDDYREFVQRRGRILRTYYDEYNGEDKKIANIYDVIVLPNDNNTSFATIELRRFLEYARLADNMNDCMQDFTDLLVRYGIDEESLIITEEVEDELDE